jgi:hypothetical protein
MIVSLRGLYNFRFKIRRPNFLLLPGIFLLGWPDAIAKPYPPCPNLKSIKKGP